MRLAAVLAAAVAASPATAAPVRLPGPSYEVLRSGPAGGAHPKRSDTATVRYVGRLADGGVFSTSAEGGAGTSDFPVRLTIPGFQALIQRMRPGDRWRLTIPSYLAYGPEGRRHAPSDANLQRDVPSDATLTFDVELVRVAPTPP